MKNYINKQFKNNFKKGVTLLALILLFSCASTKNNDKSHPLYSVLVSSDYGGANFQFYEIISEPNEFKVLLNDEILRKFVTKDDINTSNFLLLNMGQKNTGGYSIEVTDVKELVDKIVVTVAEKKPEAGQRVTEAITNPYSVVKINSKKPIEIK